MNYYQHHIVDFNKSTRHLTRLERSIYLDLIDWYLLEEKPINNDEKTISDRLRLSTHTEKQSLLNVLNDFFVLTEEGWNSSLCDKKIFDYHKAKNNHWGKKLTKAQRCAIQANRNSAKINSSPLWLTAEHKRQIADAYTQSAIKTLETGIKHEVDHQIPLRGKGVCGLHVPWNLQVIPAYKNRQKSNRQEVA